MKVRKGLLCVWIFVALFAAYGSVPMVNDVSARVKGKIELQTETKRLLSDLDTFSGKRESLNALYTDQSPKNVCNHAKRYVRASNILTGLEENLDDWKALVRQNKNDKIYRAYVATVQFAMYSIYSRPVEFLGYLKLLHRENKDLSCIRLKKSDDIPSWDEEKSDWEIKAESYLIRAQESIDKALELDSFYDDARILKAQFLVLKEEYSSAQDLFHALEQEGLFKDKRSFLNSWQAFIAVRKGDTSELKEKLKKASAFSEPAENSTWASSYHRTLKSAESEWIEFEPRDFEPAEDDDLMTLKRDTIEAMSGIRRLLAKPLKSIPHNLQNADIKDLADRSSGIYVSLDTGRSEQNLKKYALLIEDFHNAGTKLEKIIRRWDMLAAINEKTSFYYLLNKTSCELLLAAMASSSRDIVNDDKVQSLLIERLEDRSGRDETDYFGKWEEWSRLKATLTGDVQELLSRKGDLMTSDLLAFEYEAVFGNTTTAFEQLNDLKKRLNRQKRSKLPVFSNEDQISRMAYIASWTSYLHMKKGDLKGAKEALKEAGNYRGFEEWKNNFSTILYLEDSVTKK